MVRRILALNIVSCTLLWLAPPGRRAAAAARRVDFPGRRDRRRHREPRRLLEPLLDDPSPARSPPRRSTRRLRPTRVQANWRLSQVLSGEVPGRPSKRPGTANCSAARHVGRRATGGQPVDRRHGRRQTVEEVHEFIRVVARGEAEKRGQPNAVASADYRGVTGWKFAPTKPTAIIGSRLVLTQQPDWLRRVDLRADPSGANVAKSPNYRTAQQAVAPMPWAASMRSGGVLNRFPNCRRPWPRTTRIRWLAPVAPLLRRSANRTGWR